MSTKPIDFLLAPDGASARRVRRELAQKAPGLYRVAGIWTELMARAEAAYLLPPVVNDWSEQLMQAALGQTDAFWAASLKVAPRETIAELDVALRRLLEAAGPDSNWPALLEAVPADSRICHRLSDLHLLGEAVGRLPAGLQKMAHLTQAQDEPLQPIRVYYADGRMDFDAWQTAVLKRLGTDAPAPDASLQTLIDMALLPSETSRADLQTVRNLYDKGNKPPDRIDAVRVIAVRDSLAEAEIAAGMIQQALADGSRLPELGLVLPEDPLTLMAVETVFSRCGLPLSGFNRPIGNRDLGREAVRQFLLCLRKPAPIMAVAALLTSPLMAWSAAEGQVLARAVMEGDFYLKSKRIPEPARKLMDLLDERAATAGDLQGQLSRFVGLLSSNELFYDHLQRAQDAVARLQAALSGMRELDWEHLLYLTAPESLNTTTPVGYRQEGLCVFHEGELPWCDVRHLLVLGFNDGHYPGGTGSSAVFTEAEWEQIAAAGWPVETADRIRQRRRDIFAHQVAATTGQLTLILSRRGAGGQVLEPSSSLVFVARSLGLESEDLVLDLDRSEDAGKIKDLPLAADAAPVPPRQPVIADIELGVDLLEAFGRGPGEPAPLSPSAAETLMLSPFAWLLGRLDCEPIMWAADAFDVLKAGTLAHRVFEALFVAGQPLPDEAQIEARLPKILSEWVLQIAPFLRSADWRVERFKFEAEVLRAACHWKKLLTSCRAEIVAAEQWLRGQHGDVRLHGQSDLLVQLPGGPLLVVDYKKSASGKRRDRMRSGFDLQAHLYRMMIQTGGLPGHSATDADIGIVYYLMNDTTALADRPVCADGSVPGWEVLTSDISSQAMQHLDRRLAQIRKGTVQLNSDGDEAWWDKNAAMKIYGLDNSPLLRLFMHRQEVPA